MDVIALPPLEGRRPSLADLPESWRVALTEAEEWPFVDPDENGLADPDASFADYPSDPSLVPANVEPFSEDEPWGRMLTETDRQYEQFCHYRAGGITRSFKATADHFGISRDHISSIAHQKNWVARVQAWDDYREKVYTAELLQGVREMAQSHAEIARQGIEALATAFSGIVERMNDDEERAEFLAEIASLPAKAQLALAQGSARVIPNLMNAERLSRGLPTEISAEFRSQETRVTIQGVDELYSILSSIAGPLAVARSGEDEGEIVEVDS